MKHAMIESFCRRRERGTVLVLALILLVVLAALATGAMTTSVLEQRMSANAEDRNTAFQAAETALRSGEGYLQGFIGVPPPPTGTANCSPAPCVASMYASWPWGTAGQTLKVTTSTSSFSNTASPPEAVIEDMGDHQTDDSFQVQEYTTTPPSYSRFYRVTARGEGRTSEAQAMVQSVYALRKP